MSEETPVWARQPGEPLLWFRRFERFRLMEPTRSIAAVFQEEQTEKNREKPRTKPTGDWYEVARDWQWNERVAAWDAVQTAHLEQSIESERSRVLLQGYAVMYRRVARLNVLAEQLLGYATEEKRVWLPDVKAIGTGEFTQRVDLVQFNDALFREIRACLTDIAAEMGDRVKKKEVAFTDLPANVYGFDPDEDGVDLDAPEAEADEEEDEEA